MCEEHQAGVGRRAVFLTGAAAAFTLGSVSFALRGRGRPQPVQDRTRHPAAPAPPTSCTCRSKSRHGVREIKVAYTYDRPVRSRPAPTGNALDIGVFDDRGTGLGGRGFRGWSGGARTEFFLRAGRGHPRLRPRPGARGHLAHRARPVHGRPAGPGRTRSPMTLTFGEPGAARPARVPAGAGEGAGAGPGTGATAICTPGTPTAAARPRRSPRSPARPGWTSSTPPTTTPPPRTPTGRTRPGTTCWCCSARRSPPATATCVALGTDPGTFVDWRYRARDNRFGRFARQIRRAGGLVVPAHPHATCIGCNWKFGFGEADAVEVWNGPWTPDDEVALADWDDMLVASVRAGPRLDPGHGQQRRPPRPGRGRALPQTVVLADDLTRRAIQDGIRAGRAVRRRVRGRLRRLLARPARAANTRGSASGCGSRRLPRHRPHRGHRRPAAAPSASSPTRACCTPPPRCRRPGPASSSGARPRVRRVRARGGTAPGRRRAAAGSLAAFTNPVFLGRR
ncbi:hypothetical protein SALBM217S_03829 [Streptomyces griseoloalbus]